MKHIGLQSALGVAGAVLTMSTASLAAPPPPAPPPQPYTTAPPPPTVVVQPPRRGVTAPQAVSPIAPTPRTTERLVSYTGPNVPLLTTGLTTFGLSYAPALVIGAMSSQSADRNLYIPVAGPWLDMANRPACGGRGPSCTGETTNKVLLGVDGVAQGLGAAMTVVGLLVPTRHTTMTKTTAKKEGATIQISPASVGTGYGLTAVGTW
ncbi:MAG TPA: hypothetical protein VMI75_06275 [Polyangiaceae bacterium]|nr:hypothetical protein [Polyangiaceae bacterium]